MFRKVFVVGLSALLFSSSFALASPPSAHAQSANQESTNESQKPQPRTLILTATGDLEGTVVPYYDKGDIQGLETGYIDLHYHSFDTGFVDGDHAYLTIELPKEFATLAKQASFKENISGTMQRKGLLGDRSFTISQDDLTVSGARIVVKIPRELWIISGEIMADISINYGNIQKNFPIRLVQNSAEGYVFKSALRRSMAPWDPLQYPLLGTNSDTWESPYTTAYWD
ncbi:hypothetical protein ACRW9N_09320 [Listeria aquatica]|uniref:hypothetical protein n=1 Tax=Listeria aquatica TaxID=1494960 RepID=UPI0031F50BE7